MSGKRLSLNDAFGLVVAEARKKSGMSQEKLSEVSGLDRTFISDLERGSTSISVRNLEALAAALDSTPHVLLRLAEDMT